MLYSILMKSLLHHFSSYKRHSVDFFESLSREKRWKGTMNSRGRNESTGSIDDIRIRGWQRNEKRIDQMVSLGAARWCVSWIPARSNCSFFLQNSSYRPRVLLVPSLYNEYAPFEECCCLGSGWLHGG